jgi:hypothetical protein
MSVLPLPNEAVDAVEQDRSLDNHDEWVCDRMSGPKVRRLDILRIGLHVFRSLFEFFHGSGKGDSLSVSSFIALK